MKVYLIDTERSEMCLSWKSLQLSRLLSLSLCCFRYDGIRHICWNSLTSWRKDQQ